MISESDPGKEYLQLHMHHQATDTEPSIQDMNRPLSETSHSDSDEIVGESVSCQLFLVIHHHNLYLSDFLLYVFCIVWVCVE